MCTILAAGTGEIDNALASPREKTNAFRVNDPSLTPNLVAESVLMIPNVNGFVYNVAINRDSAVNSRRVVTKLP